MASKMRSARRRLRKELLRCVEAGEGDRSTLERVANEILGNDVGYQVLISTFSANEVDNAMKQLRIAREVESVGGQWLRVDALTDADVETISVRRLKRLRGEVKAQKELAHRHGRIDEAVLVGRLEELIDQELVKRETPVDAEAVVP